jgi:hypothetical protein
MFIYKKLSFLLYVVIASAFFCIELNAQWVSLGPDSAEGVNCSYYDAASGNLFIGTSIGFWYYSPTTQVWTRREDIDFIGRTVYSIAPHQSANGRIITGRVNAFFKGYLEYSNDWGVTNDLAYNSNGGYVSDVKSVPGQPDIFYACTWQDVSTGELLKSTNGGINWTLLTNYIQFTMTSLVIDNNNPNNIYVSGDALVTKSTNAGLTWFDASTGLPSTLGVYTVSIHKTNSQILLCSNDNGIYRTTNAGNSWTQVSSTTVSNIEFNPVNPNIVMAVSFSPYNLLLSTDAGATWQNYNNGFPGGSMYDLSFSSNGLKIYVASSDDGVFVYDVSSFIPVELTSFTCTAENKNVMLVWSTATELNNRGFEIQRRNLNLDDNNQWMTLGFVEGNGTTSQMNNYFYSDMNLTTGKYSYRLMQIDYNGMTTESNEIEVIISDQPEKFVLHQNYPNPFNPETEIKFEIPEPGLVNLKVFDILGKEITTLVNEELASGIYETNFDGSNLSSGTYFLTLRTKNHSSIVKMTLIK